MIRSKIKSGFSMVEILVVLIITSIMAGVAMVSFSNALKSANLQNAAERLRGDLILVRQQAMRERTNRSLTVDVANLSYAAPNVPGHLPQTTVGTSFQSGEGQISSMQLSMTSGGNTFTFDQNGNVANHGKVSLILGDRSVIVSVTKEGNCVIQ